VADSLLRRILISLAYCACFAPAALIVFGAWFFVFTGRDLLAHEDNARWFIVFMLAMPSGFAGSVILPTVLERG
jgi:hypothetical protein